MQCKRKRFLRIALERLLAGIPVLAVVAAVDSTIKLMLTAYIVHNGTRS
jgi:hypothetical protein